MHLNGTGETRSGVSHTVIESRDDEVVTPYTSAFQLDPGVTNILLQTQCALDQGGICRCSVTTSRIPTS